MLPWPLPPVLAHRCGGALAPENTLAGLNAAAACGCRGVEFDVMLSADGIPLLIHDETLERTTNGVGEVSQQTLAQLRQLDAGSWLDPRFAAERIPTMDEALIRCAEHGLAVNLEIKPAIGYERETGRAVALRIVGGCANGVPGLVISSFSEASLVAAMEVLPGAIYGLLLDELQDDWEARAATLGVKAIHVNAANLSEAQIRAVRERNYHLAAYTLNDDEYTLPVYTENEANRARTLLRAGVESVVTNFPDRMRELNMFFA